MKKMLVNVVGFLIMIGCNQSEIPTNQQIVIRGTIKTAGSGKAISNMGVKAMYISSGIGGVSKVYNSTVTDDEGAYVIRMNTDDLPCQIVTDYYPEFNLVRYENDAGDSITTAINGEPVQTKNVFLDPLGFVQLEITNYNGKYRRIQAQLSHYPHKGAFFDVGQGEKQTGTVGVWAERPDIVHVSCLLAPILGEPEKWAKDYEVQVPWDGVKQLKLAF